MITPILSALLSLCIYSAPILEHHLEFVKRSDSKIPFFYPEVSSEQPEDQNNGPGQSHGKRQGIKFGHSELARRIGVSVDDIIVTRGDEDQSGTTHVYCLHVVDGIPVDNHHAGIHLKDGQVLSYSSSFSNVGKPKSSSKPSLSLNDAVTIAQRKYGVGKDDHPATQVYLEMPGGNLALGHQFQVRDDSKGMWKQVTVDAQTGQIIQEVDYVNELSLKVVAIPKENPLNGFDTLLNPANSAASPNGWNNDGTTQYTNTQGNNVDSRVGTYRTDGTSTLDFLPTWSSSSDPTTTANRDVSIVNGFYLSNMMHDIFYQYGFTEAAGNFQKNNFGKGGAGNDRVLMNNQDASGTNNANFATPPDGQSPVMNMYLWTYTNPKRDGSLDNAIPIHEYGHGISNRLTGGAANVNCLQTTEARGLGEVIVFN